MCGWLSVRWDVWLGSKDKSAYSWEPRSEAGWWLVFMWLAQDTKVQLSESLQSQHVDSVLKMNNEWCLISRFQVHNRLLCMKSCILLISQALHYKTFQKLHNLWTLTDMKEFKSVVCILPDFYLEASQQSPVSGSRELSVTWLLSMAALFRLSPAWASWQPICLSLTESVLLLRRQLLIDRKSVV